ncbi:hypothetical protein T261_8207 [Streptomyces lydicus]|nr:hypothetical protein T261_8207 [Streptomyces lydicus]
MEPKPRPEPPPDPVPLTGCPYKSNPYPLYARMREAGPVHRVLFPNGVQAWLVTGYDAAHSALTAPPNAGEPAAEMDRQVKPAPLVQAAG